MGIEYNLYNHKNLTYYELGKGSFWIINDYKFVLFDEDLCFKLLTKEIWPKSDESDNEYLRTLSKDLNKFVKNSEEKDLIIYGDCGEEISYARMLNYVCTGSRYGLMNPKENERYIRSENERISGYVYKFDDDEIEQLTKEGWNFSKYLKNNFS